MYEHNHWMMVEMVRIYREDRLRDAEAYRLAAAARADQPRPARLTAHLLYALGQRMTGWGARLERRYRCEGELQVSPAGDC